MANERDQCGSKVKYEIQDNSMLPLIPFKNIETISGALCKIKIKNDSASGFLFDLEISTNVHCYGLVTNNHVLTDSIILNLDKINVSFEVKSTEFELSSSVIKYFFSCNLLDVTFLEFTDDFVKTLNAVKDIMFLSRPNKSNKLTSLSVGDSISIVQHARGEEAQISMGKIQKLCGVKLWHNAATNAGSSGSPVLIDKCTNVVAVHSGGWNLNDEKSINFASNIWDIIKAIKRHKQILEKDLSFLKSKTGIERYKNSDCMFIAKNYYDKPLWFFRTKYDWFYTLGCPITNEKSQLEWKRVSKRFHNEMSSNHLNRSISMDCKSCDPVTYLCKHGNAYLHTIQQEIYNSQLDDGQEGNQNNNCNKKNISESCEEIEQLKSELELLQSKIFQLNKSSEIYQEKVELLEAKLSYQNLQSHEEIETLTAINNELNTQNEEYCAKITTLEQELRASFEEIDILKSEMKFLEENSSSCNWSLQENKQLLIKVAALENKLLQSDNEAKNCKKENEILEQNLLFMKAQNVVERISEVKLTYNSREIENRRYLTRFNSNNRSLLLIGSALSSLDVMSYDIEAKVCNKIVSFKNNEGFICFIRCINNDEFVVITTNFNWWRFKRQEDRFHKKLIGRLTCNGDDVICGLCVDHSEVGWWWCMSRNGDIYRISDERHGTLKLKIQNDNDSTLQDILMQDKQLFLLYDNKIRIFDIDKENKITQKLVVGGFITDARQLQWCQSNLVVACDDQILILNVTPKIKVERVIPIYGGCVKGLEFDDNDNKYYVLISSSHSSTVLCFKL